MDDSPVGCSKSGCALHVLAASNLFECWKAVDFAVLLPVKCSLTACDQADTCSARLLCTGSDADSLGELKAASLLGSASMHSEQWAQPGPMPAGEALRASPQAPFSRCPC